MGSRSVSSGAAAIEFELRFSRRKTLAIEVAPGGLVTVRAPLGTPLAAIDARVRQKALLGGWYRRQARRVFAERLAACYPRLQPFGIPYPALKIRRMEKRWGSCIAGERISLNLKLIQAPKPAIDYVILHELCHLKVPNHSRAYYALLERVLPDWRARREALNRVVV